MVPPFPHTQQVKEMDEQWYSKTGLQAAPRTKRTSFVLYLMPDEYTMFLPLYLGLYEL